MLRADCAPSVPTSALQGEYVMCFFAFGIGFILGLVVYRWYGLWLEEFIDYLRGDK